MAKAARNNNIPGRYENNLSLALCMKGYCFAAKSKKNSEANELARLGFSMTEKTASDIDKTEKCLIFQNYFTKHRLLLDGQQAK